MVSQVFLVPADPPLMDAVVDTEGGGEDDETLRLAPPLPRAIGSPSRFFLRGCDDDDDDPPAADPPPAREKPSHQSS